MKILFKKLEISNLLINQVGQVILSEDEFINKFTGLDFKINYIKIIMNNIVDYINSALKQIGPNSILSVKSIE